MSLETISDPYFLLTLFKESSLDVSQVGKENSTAKADEVAASSDGKFKFFGQNERAILPMGLSTGT